MPQIDLGDRDQRGVAFSPSRAMTRFGLLIFTDHVEKFIPARRQAARASRDRELLSFEPQAAGTDVAGALEFLNKVSSARRRVPGVRLH